MSPPVPNEAWTSTDAQGVNQDNGSSDDAKKMLFHNWRCGPEHIRRDIHIFNVLLNGYERFGGMKPAIFVDQYYPRQNDNKGNTSSVVWPNEGNGLPDGFRSKGDIGWERLKVGTLIDRFGQEDTAYFSKFGATFAQRSLPPASLGFLARFSEDDFRNNRAGDTYRVYRVIKEFEVKSGPIAPWFGQPGGGIQIIVNASPIALTEGPFLQRLSWKEIEEEYAKRSG